MINVRSLKAIHNLLLKAAKLLGSEIERLEGTASGECRHEDLVDMTTMRSRGTVSKCLQCGAQFTEEDNDGLPQTMGGRRPEQ